MKDAEQLKWQRMEEAIKDQIISGQWRCGEKIPSYEGLGKLFGVSQITVRQVIANLKQQNYLISRERQGVFVCEKPPFRSRIGIAMANELRQVKFWREMAHSLHLAASKRGCELVIYENLQHEPAARERLLNDLKRRLLGGLYVTFREETADELFPQWRVEPDIPKFTFEPYHPPYPNQVVLKLGSNLLIRRGVEYLHGQNCRRIAYFGNHGAERLLPEYQKQIKAFNLESPPEWQLFFMMEIKEMAAKTANLLLQLPVERRPQAFFVSDDNLTLPVLQGVIEAGVKVPRDLVILSHCNWPEPQSNLLPVKYLGYNLADVAERSLDALNRYYEDGIALVDQRFGALFEEELLSARTVRQDNLYQVTV